MAFPIFHSIKDLEVLFKNGIADCCISLLGKKRQQYQFSREPVSAAMPALLICRRHLTLNVLDWGVAGELGIALAAVLTHNASLHSLCLKADGTKLSDKTGVMLAQALTQNASLASCSYKQVSTLLTCPYLNKTSCYCNCSSFCKNVGSILM